MPDEIRDRHVIRRGLQFLLCINTLGVRGQSPRRGIEIDPPHRQRVQPQSERDVIHHPLDPHHPLRPAKAAKGGGALGVGAQPVAFDPHRRQVIGVVGVQHGAVGHRQRQILGPAAAHQMHELDPPHPALIVAPDPVAYAQIVALAGDHHVVVAIIAHLARPPGGARRQRTGDRQRVALAFLAAKPAAHAAHLDPHRVHRQAKRLRHLVLNLGRMLAGRMDHHVAALLRQACCHLTFKVEVLLPADLKLAFDHPRAGANRRTRITLLPDHRPGLEPAACGQRVVDRQKRGQRVNRDHPQPGRAARRKVAFGHHQPDRLTGVVHRIHRQQRLVMRRGAAIGHHRKIAGREHRDHAGGGAHRRQIEADDPAMRHRRQAERQMQRPGRQRDVIHVARAPHDMQCCRIMRQGAAHTHADTCSTLTGTPVRSWQ